MSEPVANSWRISEWFQDLDAKSQDKMKLYFEDLQKFNRTLNLVSPKTIPFADAIHFADSIMCSRMIMSHTPAISEIYDLGSGNGFPGVIFGLLYPSVKVVLVDSDQKKCEFLNHIVGALQLPNVTVRNTFIEKLEPNSVKYAVSRGLMSISKTILLCRRVMPVGGIYFHMKGETWSNEVGEIPSQLCSVWTPGLVKDYKLPVGPIRFGLVKTDKIA